MYKKEVRCTFCPDWFDAKEERCPKCGSMNPALCAGSPPVVRTTYVGPLKDDGADRPMSPEMRAAAEKLAGRH